MCLVILQMDHLAAAVTAAEVTGSETLIEQYERATSDVSAFVPAVVQVLLFYLLDLPLFHLYRNGPSVWGIGFWGGQSYETICSQITSTDAQFWAQHVGECYGIIQRRFDGFLIMVYVPVFYLLLAATIVYAGRCAFTWPQRFCRAELVTCKPRTKRRQKL